MKMHERVVSLVISLRPACAAHRPGQIQASKAAGPQAQEVAAANCAVAMVADAQVDHEENLATDGTRIKHGFAKSFVKSVLFPCFIRGSLRPLFAS